MVPAIQAREDAPVEHRSWLRRIPPWLADDLAGAVFAGRVAIWGVVVPLAALVVAWCAILVRGDEDAALAFGGRWGEWYAKWLFGVTLALAVCGIVSALLSARRRRRRIADVHAALARNLGRGATRLKEPPDDLRAVLLGVLGGALVMAFAGPEVSGCRHTPSPEFFGHALAVAGVMLGVKKLGDATRAEEARRRFDEWKARREARRATRSAE